MSITEEKLNLLRQIIGGAPKKIALLSHTNPDGDTIGAALAWRSYLERLGHTTCCIAPNRYPYFLEWMTDIGHIGVFKEDHDGAMARFIGEADVIFCMDFNQINRLDRVTDTVTANTTAVRVLIDHHLHPPVDGYAVQFSDTHACSTSYIVYQLLEALAGTDAIDQAMAESLYVGIMTDTGNFSFSSLTSDLFRAVAVLIDKGVNVPYVNSSVYNNFSEGRMRLLGYMLNDKMVTDYEFGVAYVSLTEEEMRRFDFIQGDSEGFVNYPALDPGHPDVGHVHTDQAQHPRLAPFERRGRRQRVRPALFRRRGAPQRGRRQIVRSDERNAGELQEIPEGILRSLSGLRPAAQSGPVFPVTKTEGAREKPARHQTETP